MNIVIYCTTFLGRIQRKGWDLMPQYLWEFSFEGLFFAENGEEVIEQATAEEQSVIQEIQAFYDETAAHCRQKIHLADKETIIHQIPNLMYFDVKLQLCLIYSFSIINNPMIDPECGFYTSYG